MARLSTAPQAPGILEPLSSQTSERLLSLDALRGFDMFWIVGGEEIFHAWYKATGGPVAGAFAHQLDHAPWEGFRAYDLIFPTFLFMVGVSLVFSLTKLLRTQGRSGALRRVLVRGVVLYAIGILYYGGFSKEFEHIRLMGVLQRLAIGYLITGLLFCFLNARGLAVAAGLCLVVYWALMTFIAAPGEPKVSFAEGHNLANWIDAHYLPFRKWDGDHDPEGLLSNIPAVATCLLGALCGCLLRNSPKTQMQKVAILIVGGAIGVGAGLLWGLQFPIIKKLWTSSFVLLAGGLSAILLGLFYLVIDVWKIKAWCRPFVWIGTNAITLYLLEHFLHFDELAELFVGGEFGKKVFGQYNGIALTITAVLVMFAVARFLYNRRIFIKV